MQQRENKPNKPASLHIYTTMLAQRERKRLTGLLHRLAAPPAWRSCSAAWAYRPGRRGKAAAPPTNQNRGRETPGKGREGNEQNYGFWSHHFRSQPRVTTLPRFVSDHFNPTAVCGAATHPSPLKGVEVLRCALTWLLYDFARAGHRAPTLNNTHKHGFQKGKRNKNKEEKTAASNLASNNRSRMQCSVV